MRQDPSRPIIFVLVMITALAGCGGGARFKSAAPMSSGGSIITIEAGNYKFSPKEIRVEKPGLLAVEVKNVSGSEHNLTLKDPRGKILKTVDLHPRLSVIFNVELLEPGVYKFYCDKSFHSSYGMKGEIVVGR